MPIQPTLFFSSDDVVLISRFALVPERLSRDRSKNTFSLLGATSRVELSVLNECYEGVHCMKTYVTRDFKPTFKILPNEYACYETKITSK